MEETLSVKRERVVGKGQGTYVKVLWSKSSQLIEVFQGSSLQNVLPSALPSLLSVYDLPNMKLFNLASPLPLHRKSFSFKQKYKLFSCLAQEVHCSFSFAIAFVQSRNKWAGLRPHLQKARTYSPAWSPPTFLRKIWSQYNSIGFLRESGQIILGNNCSRSSAVPGNPA